MRLGISECKGSSEAEWNEQPGAYVLKSQLSQAQRSPLSQPQPETLQGRESASAPSVCTCSLVMYVCRHHTQPYRIHNTTS